MDTKILEDGIQEQLGAIEAFLKTILLKKINVELAASSMADQAMVIEALKTGTVVIHSRESNFESEVFFAFDENWIPQLSTAMLGVEETEVNEITRDLIKEFSAQFLGTVQTSLQGFDVPIDPQPVELLKSAQITNAVPAANYFMAQIDVTGKFLIDGDEQPQMSMIICFGIPSDDKIEELMGVSAAPAPAPAPKAKAPAQAPAAEMVDEDDLAAMFDEPAPRSASKAAPSGGKSKSDEKRDKASKQPQVTSIPVEFEDINPSKIIDTEVEVRNLEILKDVELDISVELGRKELPLGDVLHLVRGSIIELDKLAGEPVEIYANGHRIAEGEVVVIDEHFGVRITNLVSTKERLESLR